MLRHETGELLVQLLRDRALQNQVVTYEEVSELVGFNVQEDRSILYTAFSKVLADYNYGFECVRNVGYRPIKGIKQAEVAGTKARKKIKTTTKKWRDQYEAVKPVELDQQELDRYIREGLKLHLVEESVADSSTAKIDAAMESAQGNSPLSSKNMKKMLRDAMYELAGVS